MKRLNMPGIKLNWSASMGWCRGDGYYERGVLIRDNQSPVSSEAQLIQGVKYKMSNVY